MQSKNNPGTFTQIQGGHILLKEPNDDNNKITENKGENGFVSKRMESFVLKTFIRRKMLLEKSACSVKCKLTVVIQGNGCDSENHI